jgi:hypothetical protein
MFFEYISQRIAEIISIKKYFKKFKKIKPTLFLLHVDPAGFPA